MRTEVPIQIGVAATYSSSGRLSKTSDEWMGVPLLRSVSVRASMSTTKPTRSPALKTLLEALEPILASAGMTAHRQGRRHAGYLLTTDDS